MGRRYLKIKKFIAVILVLAMICSVSHFSEVRVEASWVDFISSLFYGGYGKSYSKATSKATEKKTESKTTVAQESTTVEEETTKAFTEEETTVAETTVAETETEEKKETEDITKQVKGETTIADETTVSSVLEEETRAYVEIEEVTTEVETESAEAETVKETEKSAEKETKEEETTITDYETTAENEGVTPGLANKKVIEETYIDFDESVLDENKNKLSFYEDGNNYRFGITADNKEMISFKDKDGNLIDVLEGAGDYVVRDTTFYSMITYKDSISSYETEKMDGYTKVIVNYKETKDGVIANTEYDLYPDRISVIANISNINGTEVGTSFFQRNFVNGYVDYELRENTDWVFPENNDFPYKDFDSIVMANFIDSNHKLYTFFRGDSANTHSNFETYKPEYLPLMVTDNKLDEYKICYDLVFENLKEDNDPDYFALYKGKGDEIALGITPTTATIEDSTIFNETQIEFDVNVSNLSDMDKNAVISYRIYDYYGNAYNETSMSEDIKGNDAINLLVDMDLAECGIYYFDLTVDADGKNYHELYPFGYIPKYEYKYNETSPFGISGIRFGDYQSNDTTIALMKNLGVANARVGISKPEYINDTYDLLEDCLKQVSDNGTKVTGQSLLMNDWSFSSDMDDFQLEIEESLKHVSNYLTSYEVGNETNLYPVFDTKEAAMDNYLKNEFYAGYNAISKYKNIDFTSSGIYQTMFDWMALMHDEGIWNKTDVLSTHAYGFPHSPDHTNDVNIEHSFESGLNRARQALDAYGDKDWYLSEMGYPTIPLNNKNMFSGVDLRTQADYTYREFILALAYGADVVESYGFYDQLNLTKGTNGTDTEYHYGMFYDQDYYGRVMPKPLALAYGAMTRNLESVKDCYSLDLSSSTIRAFGLDLSENNETAYVLWSNCSLLSNDAVDGERTPNLPWNNQWNKTETVKVYSSEDVIVTDIMGNETVYSPVDNVVSIEVSGSPVMVTGNGIYGAE
ncbi:hypothetical protein SAMN02910289_01112 [Lachnospiraceae bacterium RM5]|nr:hypothetical protein SAMN02910289_01112 [Lachnospiraceae bacterium RM5]